jgi:hypothetical protein
VSKFTRQKACLTAGEFYKSKGKSMVLCGTKRGSDTTEKCVRSNMGKKRKKKKAIQWPSL